MGELRDAFRALRATPLVSVVVILSLALGIGANVALFSILNAMVLRPLPVPSPERLVRVVVGNQTMFTRAVWEQIREHEVFAAALAWRATRLDIAETGPNELAHGMWVSGDAFEILGVKSTLGRLLSPEDDRPGGGRDGPAVVISHRLWQTRFAGTTGVVGRTLTLERMPFRIVGVTPPAFTGLDIGLPFDFALPIAAMPLTGHAPAESDGRLGPWLHVMGRLADGDTAAAAAARLRATQARIREVTLPDYARPEDRDAFLSDPLEVVPAAASASFLRRRYERPLEALLLIVTLVLVVACANIANLLLARAATRRHELSVRAALGAGRARLARLLLAESALLAGAGSALALLFAAWGSRLLVSQLSSWNFTAFLDLSLDLRVLGFTAVAGVLTALLFGTLPAWRAASADPIEALRFARLAGDGGTRLGAAGVLVVAQVAVSLALLGAAGLFLRSFAVLATLDVGFDRDAVLVAEPDLRRTAVMPEGRSAFAERLREAVAAAPGVASASVSVVLPAGMMKATRIVEVLGVSQGRHTVQANEMSVDWFRTMGIPIVAGRDFSDADRSGAPVAIVNRAFVTRYLGGQEPIGAALVDVTPGLRRRSVTIVGVAGDAVYYSIREPAPPTFYLPLAQAEHLPARLNLCVKGAGGPRASVSRTVAAAVGRVDPNVSLSFRTLADQVNATFARERLIAIVSTLFGGLAALLAALGLYGVMAHTVARRRGEIGIRLALGATPAAVTAMVLRRAGGLAGMGLASGVLLSLWASRFAESLLFGVGPRDVATLVAASALLAIVTAGASWLPSRSAARVDPVAVIREG